MNTVAARTLVIAAAIAWLLFGAAPQLPATSTASSAVQRLLGPVAGLAAGVEWVRFDAALRDGNPERAYVHAETALALRPSSPAGWSAFARHLIFDRASRESEPDPERRRYWIRAGLALLERGEARCARPGELAFMRGNVLANFVAVLPDEELGWPGGARAALDEALRAFELASDLGDARGREHAAFVRSELQRPVR